MPSAIPCFSLFLVSTLLSRTGGVLSHLNFSTPQISSISAEELVLSRFHYSGHSLLSNFYLSRIGRIENPCSACGQPSQDTSHLFLQCSATDSCAARSSAIFCLSTTFGRVSGELPGFWDSIVIRHAPSKNPTISEYGCKII